MPPPVLFVLLSLAVLNAMVILLNVLLARMDTSVLLPALPVLMAAKLAPVLVSAHTATTLLISSPVIKQLAFLVTKLPLALPLLLLPSFLSSSR